MESSMVRSSILPVTAVETVSLESYNLVLVGEGPFIKIFSSSSRSLMSIVRVFVSQAVHGITSRHSSSLNEEDTIYCAVWGGRSSGFLRIRVLNDGLCVSVVVFRGKKASDWILDAQFIVRERHDEEMIIYVDAHNDLYSLTCSANKDECQDNEHSSVAQGPPSALYSAHIKVHSDGIILVASGTVFGGVHLWMTTLNAHGSSQSRLVSRYTGHEGSVYGIRIANTPGVLEPKQVILSCSDDRTVKVWHVPEDLQKDGEILSEDASTGFERLSRNHESAQELASGSGHLSRIWKVFSYVLRDGSPGLITLGEDASAQLWNLHDNESLGLRLSKSKLLNLHTGKNIWSGTVLDSRTNPQLVAGGADGQVTVSKLQSLGQVVLNTSSSDSFTPRDQFRAYCWLSATRLLAVGSSGTLYSAHIQTSNGESETLWSLVAQIQDLTRYTVMKSLGSSHALIAGSTGAIYHYNALDHSVQPLLQMSGKCSFLHGSPLKDVPDKQEIAITASCLGSQKVYYGKLSLSNSFAKLDASTLQGIDLSPGFLVTSSQFVPSELLVLGSRNGQLAFCRLNTENEVVNISYVKSVHGKEAVTSILLLPTGDWILTTGRDSCFKIHRFSYHEFSIDVDTIHSGRLPFGPDIEGAAFIDDELQIWGFRGTEFLLWSHNNQQELFSIDCGGQHRSWSFFHGSTSALAWTKGGEAHVSQLKSHTTILQQGSHGREIKALAVRQRKDDLGEIVATGAEDTCIRLSTYSPEVGLRTLHVIPNHTTGLQALAWSKDGQLLCSAAGKEEFYIWEIQRVPLLDIGVRLVAQCPYITDSQILRIMDFDTLYQGDQYLIAMVYSDSSIRTWSFIPGAAPQLLREAIHSTRCLTQCRIVDQHVLTASTDGSLTLWDLNNLEKKSTKRVHQSSIKGLTLTMCDEWIFIATGGDDDALCLTLLKPGDVCVWQSLLIPKAHASAINSLTFTDWHENTIRLITSGNDQRVKIWDVSSGKGSSPRIDICLATDVSTAVADVSCMGLFEGRGHQQTLIAGVGVEFLDIE